VVAGDEVTAPWAVVGVEVAAPSLAHAAGSVAKASATTTVEVRRRPMSAVREEVSGIGKVYARTA